MSIAYTNFSKKFTFMEGEWFTEIQPSEVDTFSKDTCEFSQTFQKFFKTLLKNSFSSCKKGRFFANFSLQTHHVYNNSSDIFLEHLTWNTSHFYENLKYTLDFYNFSRLWGHETLVSQGARCTNKEKMSTSRAFCRGSALPRYSHQKRRKHFVLPSDHWQSLFQTRDRLCFLLR